MTPEKQLIKEIDRDHPSASDICAWATKNGFNWLGDGSFTMVYGKESASYVLKVNTRPDPAAYKFHSMIAGKSSIYFPKVHKLRTYVDYRGKFLFVAVMERLHKIDDTAWEKVNKRGEGFAMWLATYPRSQLTYVKTRVGTKERKEMATKWANQNSASVKFVDDLSKAISGFGSFDLHGSNIMMRLPSGDVVLNDPVYSS